MPEYFLICMRAREKHNTDCEKKHRLFPSKQSKSSPNPLVLRWLFKGFNNSEWILHNLLFQHFIFLLFFWRIFLEVKSTKFPDIFLDFIRLEVKKLLIYISSKVCLWHISISNVYGQITMKFGMMMVLWTLITGKLLLSGYLGNCCHGDQKAFSELYNGLFWFWTWVQGSWGKLEMKYWNVGYHGYNMLP